jgi:hypothetical protein
VLQERAEATELSRTCLFGHAEIRIVLVGGDVRDKAKEWRLRKCRRRMRLDSLAPNHRVPRMKTFQAAWLASLASIDVAWTRMAAASH